MICSRMLRAAGALALATAALVPLGTVLAGPAGASTFTVTVGADSGAGSLRQALADAAGNAGDDVIDVTAGLTITLDSGITYGGSGGVTINGNGATVTGSGASYGLANVAANALTINALGFTGFGAPVADDAAPVISAAGGTVTLTDCTFTGNAMVSTAGDAAGAVLSNGGAVSITNCTITGNSATASPGSAGGGVLVTGATAVIVTSTISGNTATSSSADAAGGVMGVAGQFQLGMTVRDSTIDCNVSSALGVDSGDSAGAILWQSGDITINGSSVVGNVGTAVSLFGTESNSMLSTGSILGTGNTISDAGSGSCTAPPPPPPPTPTPTPTPATAVAAAAKFTG